MQQFTPAAPLGFPTHPVFLIPAMNSSEIAEALANRGIIVGIGAACSSGSLRPAAALLSDGCELRSCPSCAPRQPV